MSLPILQSDSRVLNQMQTQWASELNPVLSNPLVSGRQIQSVSLATGANTVNHLLSRKLQGYIVTTKSADVTIYDSQLTNSMPDKTLVLVSTGPVVISLWVY